MGFTIFKGALLGVAFNFMHMHMPIIECGLLQFTKVYFALVRLKLESSASIDF